MTDTSHEYVRMCDCPEVQDKRPDLRDMETNHGEYFYGKYCENWNDEYDAEVKRQKGDNLDHYYSLVPLDDDYVWLPDQRTLQEWCGVTPANFSETITRLITQLNGGILSTKEAPDSFEKIWLMLFMATKHHRRWTGDKWEAME